MKNKRNLAHSINRLTTFIVGTYIIALSYNTFLKPNSLVIYPDLVGLLNTPASPWTAQFTPITSDDLHPNFL